jgi:AcrR family transcriptional regulator
MSRPGPAPEADSTRRRILDTALELFTAQGFAATSTRELSERLGFTKAALYYHFRTKDELLEALVAPVVAELTALVDPFPAEVPPLEAGARDRIVAGYLDVIVEHRRLLGVLVQDPSAGVRPAVAAGRAFYARLITLLTGTAEPSAEQRTRVRFVLGGLHAAVLFARPDDDVGTLRAGALAAARAVLGTGPEGTAQR